MTERPSAFEEIDRKFYMTPEEIVNLSLSSLTFAYNLHFATFKDETVQKIHVNKQILNGSIHSSDDFETLTNNCLLSSFLTHAIFLHEALKEHSKNLGRDHNSPTDLMWPIRQFVDELRHTHAHPKDLKFVWDTNKGKKLKSHTFQTQLPVIKTSKTTQYDPNSINMRKFLCDVIPGQEFQMNQTFLLEIIIFSFHIREIMKFQDRLTCDQFLKKFDSSWEEKF